MDMSYATIPVFGQDKILYREVLLKYMVNNKSQPTNHPIYSVSTKLGSSIFFNDICLGEEETKIVLADKGIPRQQLEEISEQQGDLEDQIWKMNFDGAACREGAGASMWINHPKGDAKLCSYKLVFECANNMAKYEALILGLKALEELGAKRIVVLGDFELIINQIKGIYKAKHPRLRAYKNMVLELLEKFSECNHSSIPREQNQVVHELATSAAVFKVPIFPEKRYKVEFKYRPTIPDNMKH